MEWISKLLEDTEGCRINMRAIANRAQMIAITALLHKSNPVRKSSGQATEKVEGVGQRLRR